MTRKEMDKLNVGDKIEVKVFNEKKWDFEWIPTKVSQVLVCTDGDRFAHGGYCSVMAKVNGLTYILEPETTRLAKA